MEKKHNLYINKLKNNFDKIISLKHNIIQTINDIGEKLLQLKNKYNELVKMNSKKIFLFCFDSFFSQYKTFLMELEHFEKYKALLNNRTYSDFFKLYNIIISYCKDNKNDFIINPELLLKCTTFTAYKDLEPYYEYDINEISNIHENIILLIDELYNNYLKKDETMNDYKNNHKIGFTISNFINTLDYENILLKQQISLFINFLSFFQISQKNQLDCLMNKLNKFFNDVIENLDNNQTFSVDDIDDNLEEQAVVQEQSVVEESVTVVAETAVVEEPVTVVEESVTVVEESVTVVEEPAVILVEEPAVILEEPAVVVEEPAVVVEEPVVIVEEPVVVVEEPAVVVEEPAVVVEEPAVVVEEPAVVEEEPAVVVEEPAVVVEEPATIIEEPSVVEEPAVVVEEPAVIEIPEIPEIPEIQEIPDL